MRQHEVLGKILRNEYIDNLQFLSKDYNKTEFEVYSTEENRTFQSGISFMHGFYPPGTGQKLNQVEKLDEHLPPYSNKTDITEQNFALPNGQATINIKRAEKILLNPYSCPNYEQMVQDNIDREKSAIEEM